MNIMDVAANVRLFELEPEAGTQSYSGGAHIDVSVLVNGLPQIRSYSLVGRHGQTGGRYHIGVKRLPTSRGGSTYMWSLAPGNTYARCPRPGWHRCHV